MAQKAQNQIGADVQLGLRVAASTAQAFDHGGHGHTACGVGLGVKKQFSPHHMVGGGFLKVGPGHVVKIWLVQQHAGAGIVQIQKALQIGEGIGRPHGGHVGIRQSHAIALGQRKNQLRLQRAFDVNMQLGLGHDLQQLGQTVRGNGVDFEHGELLMAMLDVNPEDEAPK